MALRISGDGLFRISALLNDAMRHLYREVASRLSPNRTAGEDQVSSADTEAKGAIDRVWEKSRPSRPETPNSGNLTQ